MAKVLDYAGLKPSPTDGRILLDKPQPRQNVSSYLTPPEIFQVYVDAQRSFQSCLLLASPVCRLAVCLSSDISFGPHNNKAKSYYLLQLRLKLKLAFGVTCYERKRCFLARPGGCYRSLNAQEMGSSRCLTRLQYYSSLAVNLL